MIERNEPMRFGHKVMTTVAASILTLGAAPALAASASTTHPVASHAVTLPATSPACGQGFVRISGSQSTNGEYQEETGFTGAESAISYTWQEAISVTNASGDTYSYIVHQSGGLWSRSSWTGQHTATDTDTPLTVTVTVLGTYFLANETICADTGSVSAAVPVIT
jgi:hypothetical protein